MIYLSRRTLLKAGLGFGAVALVGCGSDSSDGGDGSLPEGGKLQMKGWSFHPELVEEHIQIYREMYADNVAYELVPANYDPVMETKFIGGQQVDMCYIFPERIQRWNEADWIRDLNDMDGIDDIKSAMYPNEIEKFSTLDGRLGALPYFTAWFVMAYNADHIDQLGGSWTPPATWEEFLEQCRQLKTDGIAEHPYLPMWRPTPSNFPDQMFTDMYSQGEPIFDADNNPTFGDGGVAFRSTFEMYRTMYDEQLVPPDVFALAGPQTFATGEHTFWSYVVYGLADVNNPESSQIAGRVKLVPYPGTAGNVLTVGGGYAMGANPQDEEATWELLKYFGSKANDGNYVIAKRWALLAGLPSAYPEVMDDPEIIANYQTTWGDFDVAMAQHATSKARTVDKTLWFAEWMQEAVTRGSDYIIGESDIDDLITTLNDKAIELKESYGG